ncbi:alpha/beta fold hydrolase [Nucisporomicrobium flavum]|uniref:alpha/beta fold hydrolase n=1 Tax=Nucisporomicrobium flavum TaxID=2785915 RepID=UPI0018F32D33|nr:alpha/beta hydrolase [Nucisporomicrobium flavum]
MSVTLHESGSGHPFLLLHGGAGPMSVAGFADRLAAARPARVLVPTHPGFNGTPRPDDLTDVPGLARLYAGLLEERGLTDVTVVGNSIGGWIAAEMAVLASPRVSSVIIVNGVGLEVPGHPVADFFSLSMDQLADLSYHEPDKFRTDPASLSEAQKALMAGNRPAIAQYAGSTMTDPTLAGRLAEVTVPVLVLWGQSDRIVDPAYGRAYAAAIPTATYQPLENTGHLPQIETPEQTLTAFWDFAAKHATGGPAGE